MGREEREPENGRRRRLLDPRSARERLVNDHFCTGKCVSRRQACSVGRRPTGVRARGPVAWMAGQRETDALKPIDDAIGKDGSEWPGRNVSERKGSPESA
jgi:hypothetical protein